MHRFFGAVLTLLLIGALPARAAEDPPSATVFAEPAERVALSDGRRMNVVCLGCGDCALRCWHERLVREVDIGSAGDCSVTSLVFVRSLRYGFQ